MAMWIRQPDFNWEGLSTWWSAHSDGSHSPVSGEEDEENYIEQNLDDEELDWLADAYDVVDRVHQIGRFFTQDVDRGVILTPTEFEASLVELQMLVEYVDITKQLHSDNNLAPLLHKMLSYDVVDDKHDAAVVRAKAAEVVTTMVQNNRSSQKLVMQVNGLQPLLHNFISDPDVTARTEALVAISSLIQNNRPGITAFLQDNGYAALKDALSSECVRLQREALNLIQYLLHQNSSDCNIVTRLGFPRIMMHLTSSDDAQVREASLRGLLVLARGEVVRNDDKLKQVLQERIEGISAMAPEDLGAAKEERQLVDSLWNACYNEPSSLGVKGLLVLPDHHRSDQGFTMENKKCGDEDCIQSPHFIDLHTTATNTLNSSSSNKFGSFILHIYYRTGPVLLMLSSQSESESADDQEEEELVVKVDDLLIMDNLGITEKIILVGSCNGLVCLHGTKSKQISLWNPDTEEYRVLPKSRTTIDRPTYNLVGFGFDVETKDYKVVQFTGLKPRRNGNGSEHCFCRVQVYSLSTNSWRLLEGIPCLPGYPFDYTHSVLYLNGTCFFLAHFFYTERYPCLPVNDRFIISFDFTKEIITPIQLPHHHRNQDLCLCSLGDNQIALFTSSKVFVDDDETVFRNDIYDETLFRTFDIWEEFNIWVLNYEHGGSSSSSVNKNSWTKLYTFKIQLQGPGEWYIPRGISNDGKFALLAPEYGKKMKLYNLETNEVKRDFLSCSKVESKAHAYKRSSVSVRGGNGAGSSSSSSSR